MNISVAMHVNMHRWQNRGEGVRVSETYPHWNFFTTEIYYYNSYIVYCGPTYLIKFSHMYL